MIFFHISIKTEQLRRNNAQAKSLNRILGAENKLMKEF